MSVWLATGLGIMPWFAQSLDFLELPGGCGRLLGGLPGTLQRNTSWYNFAPAEFCVLCFWRLRQTFLVSSVASSGFDKLVSAVWGRHRFAFARF